MPPTAHAAAPPEVIASAEPREFLADPTDVRAVAAAEGSTVPAVDAVSAGPVVCVSAFGA